MKNDLQPFSLMWLPVGGDNRYPLIPDDLKGQVPWFISGKSLDDSEENNTFTLKEEFLLKGILYGLSPGTCALGAIYKEEDLLVILDKLQQGYNYKNREELILHAASSIRNENGILPCLRILKTGMYLLPESSKIKSDYTIGLWDKACEDEDDVSIYEEILELIPQINLADTYGEAKEAICYYGFCSLFFLKHDTKLKQDVSKYIEQYIVGVITMNEIQVKIDDLLNNPDKEFTPSELRIHDD